MRPAAFILLASFLLGGATLAETNTVTLDGLVEHQLSLSAADLASLPSTEFDASFLTGHGSETAHYKGISVWSLVESAALAVEPGKKRGDLRHYLLVTGRDGYAVVISFGEINPDFEGKQVILAYDRDGKPFDAGGFRLIVPGDKHGGRNVQNVVQIEVK